MNLAMSFVTQPDIMMVTEPVFELQSDMKG